MVFEVTNFVRSEPIHFAVLSQIISPVDTLVFFLQLKIINLELHWSFSLNREQCPFLLKVKMQLLDTF